MCNTLPSKLCVAANCIFRVLAAQIIKRPSASDDVLRMIRQPHLVPTKRAAHTKRGHRRSNEKRTVREAIASVERNSMREHLVLCYRILSEAYEAVQGLSLSSEEDVSGAVAIIIEDDLRSLLEECEGFLIDRGDPQPSGLSSFEARSLTVIEEVNSIIALVLPKNGSVWH